ncbi:hypothetical protein [Nostoc sp.]|uniref:hypothetical protein n=1 Tax=Nostoc sp. TaxID=1180 RepID=UPI002FFADD1B
MNKSNLLLVLATRSRTPVAHGEPGGREHLHKASGVETPLAPASPFGRRPHWLGYTRLYPPTWVKNLSFCISPRRWTRACVVANSIRLIFFKHPLTFHTNY